MKIIYSRLQNFFSTSLLFVFILFLFSIFFSSSISFAQSVDSERIDLFLVSTRLNQDASFDVREDITYNTGGLIKHGIYRDIRLKSAQGNPIKIYGIGVNAPFVLEYPDSGMVRIKIGNPNVTFSGEKKYTITYHIKGAVSYYDNFDEIYWNATGNNWNFPIMAVSAIIEFADGIHFASSSCYYGPAGSTDKCDISPMNAGNVTPEVQIARVPQGIILQPRSGLTFASSFAKGEVAYDPVKDSGNFIWLFIIGLSILFPIVIFIIFFKQWNRYGKDPKSDRTIIAQYDIPDNLTPLEIYGIMKEKIDAKAISAEIIYLAIHGYIKIEKIEEKGFIMNKDDYLFKRLLEASPENVSDQKIVDGLFAFIVGQLDRIPGQVKMSDLRNVFYKKIKRIASAVFGKLVQDDYLKSNPEETRFKYRLYAGSLLIIACLLFSVIIKFAYFFGSFFSMTQSIVIENPLPFLSILFSSIIVLCFSFIMPARTEKGLSTKEYILGLKEYLQIAEKDRINFHNAPEKKPETFEKFLPYAMVLGVEKAWAKEFEGIYIQQPNWYNDSNMSTFSTAHLIVSLNHFTSYSSNTIVSTPSSSGSGSGGGGFSGGGGGGGGGGSW